MRESEFERLKKLVEEADLTDRQITDLAILLSEKLESRR